MKFSAFAQLITKLKALDDEREAYTLSLPADIAPCIYDNVYTNASGMMLDAALQAAFATMSDYTDDIYSFLYESGPHHTVVGNKRYMINNVEDYLAYAKEVFDCFDDE